MEHLDFATVDEERVKDVIAETPSGQMCFKVRYATPELTTQWRHTAIARGYAGRDMDPKPGRMLEYCRLLAELFVVGWSGPGIKPEGLAYTPDLMAKAMCKRMDIYRLIDRSLAEDAGFFARNGNEPTPS